MLRIQRVMSKIQPYIARMEEKEEVSEKRNKRIQHRRKLLDNKEKYESIFDIVLFKSEEEAKAELMERPNSDYYKKATSKCTICYSVFKWPKLLNYHMKWHDPSTGDHKCDICEMRYNTQFNAYRHKLNCHVGRYSCRLCPLVTYNSETMMRHFESHQGVQHTCQVCDKTFTHVTTFLTHKRTCHRSQHVCSLCARTFISAQGLRQHRTVVHQATEDVETESSVKCEECNLSFSNQDVYLVHLRKTPFHKNSIICLVCGKKFEDTLTLAKHKHQEHPLQTMKEYTCKECGAVGKGVSFIIRHYKTKHPDLTCNVRPRARPREQTRDKKHLCDQCGTSFQSHIGDRRYKCSLCGKGFIHAVNLREHVRGVHQNVKRVRKPRQRKPTQKE